MSNTQIQPILEAVGLSKVYAQTQTHALNNVNLSISSGEFVGIIGPSGSGKSTLLNIFAALSQPSQGQVLFKGKPLSKIRNKSLFRRRNIGFIFQDFYLYPRFTVLENVLLPLAHKIIVSSQWKEKAKQMLGYLNMDGKISQRANTLSAGERQRVCIARALLNEPALILADEPTGSLDTKNSKAILDILEKIHSEQNVTIIMVTHDNEAAGRTKRIIEIVDGTVSP